MEDAAAMDEIDQDVNGMMDGMMMAVGLLSSPVPSESSSVATIGFYERFGWRVSGLVDGPGGRRTTAMWRPAGGA